MNDSIKLEDQIEGKIYDEVATDEGDAIRAIVADMFNETDKSKVRFLLVGLKDNGDGFDTMTFGNIRSYNELVESARALLNLRNEMVKSNFFQQSVDPADIH